MELALDCCLWTNQASLARRRELCLAVSSFELSCVCSSGVVAHVKGPPTIMRTKSNHLLRTSWQPFQQAESGQQRTPTQPKALQPCEHLELCFASGSLKTDFRERERETNLMTTRVNLSGKTSFGKRPEFARKGA